MLSLPPYTTATVRVGYESEMKSRINNREAFLS